MKLRTSYLRATISIALADGGRHGFLLSIPLLRLRSQRPWSTRCLRRTAREPYGESWPGHDQRQRGANRRDRDDRSVIATGST